MNESSEQVADSESFKHHHKASRDSPGTSLLDATPESWPTMPKPVDVSKITFALDIAVDIIIFILSLAFFAFGPVVISYNEAAVEDHNRSAKMLQNAAKYGPTMFPILFACVLSRAAHAVMMWRLEKGEHVGTLDLLASSTSLTSTITSQIKMRIFSILGFTLVGIWILSPVGGQASLRLIDVVDKTSDIPNEFSYMIHTANSASLPGLWNPNNTDWDIVYALFGAATLAGPATKSSPLDTFGNVKIPYIEHYENISTANSEGWFEVKTGDPSTYSSLAGIPMSGINSTEFVNYVARIESSYLYLDCILNKSITRESVENAFYPPTHGQDMWWFENITERRNTDTSDLKPFSFIYIISDPASRSSGYPTQCDLTTTWVEAEIFCPTSGSCAASKFRRSRQSHPIPGYTLFDHIYADPGIEGDIEYAQNASNWETFAEAFLNAFIKPIYYIEDPTNPLIGNGTEDPIPINLHTLRVNQLLNTFWTAMYMMEALTSDLYEFSRRRTPASEGRPDLSSMPDIVMVNGTRSTQEKVIKGNVGWAATLCVASAIMVISSLVNPLMRYGGLIRAPDLMLNISSLATRNNPYIKLPQTGTYLDAADRSRFMKGLRVRLGDVDSDGEVGKLAIGDHDGKVGRLRKGRLYE